MHKKYLGYVSINQITLHHNTIKAMITNKHHKFGDQYNALGNLTDKDSDHTHRVNNQQYNTLT